MTVGQRLKELRMLNVKGKKIRPSRKPVMISPPKLSTVSATWRELALGTGIRNAGAFREAIRNSGMSVSESAKGILRHLVTSSDRTLVGLVVASVADLGFDGGAAYGDICGSGRGLGLKLCPNEVGPQLRLQYDSSEPGNEHLRIAMKPIAGHDRSLCIFEVSFDLGVRMLDVCDGARRAFYSASDRFVFLSGD